MPTAKICIDGLSVEYDTNTDELIKIINALKNRDSPKSTVEMKVNDNKPSTKTKIEIEEPVILKPPTSLMDILRGLIKEGFFNTYRSVGEVNTALKQKGHLYDISLLSTYIGRLTKPREDNNQQPELIRKTLNNGKHTYIKSKYNDPKTDSINRNVDQSKLPVDSNKN